METCTYVSPTYNWILGEKKCVVHWGFFISSESICIILQNGFTSNDLDKKNHPCWFYLIILIHRFSHLTTIVISLKSLNYFNLNEILFRWNWISFYKICALIYHLSLWTWEGLEKNYLYTCFYGTSICKCLTCIGFLFVPMSKSQDVHLESELQTIYWILKKCLSHAYWMC